MTPRATELAQADVRGAVRPGESAVAGNGHDTRFLAELVGPAGRVFAFEVQPAAVARTEALLAEAGLTNVTLLLRDHADLAAVAPGTVGAVMFNLGYLPGGDKAVV